jgi:hypothetical protein
MTSQAEAKQRLMHATNAKTYLFIEVSSYGSELRKPL